MNIHQLLSASQNSPQTQPHGAFGRQDSPNGFFQQALSQATAAQRLPSSEVGRPGSLQAPSQQAPLDELSGLLSAALGMDPEELSTALESLGLKVSEEDLSQLLTQLQSPSSVATLDSLAHDTPQGSDHLSDITARLNLMSSFAADTLQAPSGSLIDPEMLQAIVQQLAEEALPGNTTPMLDLFTDQSGLARLVDPITLASIKEQLSITQIEAEQFVSALTVVGQQQLAHSLPADYARLTNSPALSNESQVAARAQTDTFFTQVNANTAFSQISSDALMGALMTVEGTPKGGQLGEHSLTGFSLTNGSNPLASAQTAQGFAPSVAPTPASLPMPLTSPAWPQQLGQQLVQISQRGGEQHVQMQLNPAELGPLSISLKFGEQGAQAHFLSAHPQVRQVLEQAIPQLREALAEQGISLGETSVGEQRDPNAQAFAQSGGNRGSGIGDDSGGDGSEEKSALGAESSPLVIDGRVDLYA